MTSTFIYLPILKWKQGEQLALKELTKSDRELVFPLIELMPLPRDEDGKPTVGLKEHLDKAAKKLKVWTKERSIAVDFLNLPPRSERGVSIGKYFINSCRAAGYKVVPSLGITADGSVDATAMEGVSKEFGCVFRVRLPHEGFERFQQSLLAALAATKLEAADVHLVIDFWALDNVALSNLMDIAKDALASARDTGNWRSISVAGGSFPFNLAGLRQGAITFSRLEWLLWRGLVNDGFEDICIGDYTVTHPAPVPELDPRTVNATAAIRYAREETWLLLKGRTVRDHGFDQYNDLCKLLISSPEYDGPTFSYGDSQYSFYAGSTTSTGNLMTWRRDATNHHVTLTARRAAKLSAFQAPL